MGGKGGGGGSNTPEFVRAGTRSLSDRSDQLFDLARPLLESGTSQVTDLIRTGGPGANVPIINQAVAAQRGATDRAQAEIGGDLRRAGLERTPPGASGGTQSGPVASRIRERIQQQGDASAARIPTRAAAPLIQAAISTAIGGNRTAGQGFQGALTALGTASQIGQEAAAAARANRLARARQLGSNLVGLTQFGADQGAFEFLLPRLPQSNRSAGISSQSG